MDEGTYLHHSDRRELVQKLFKMQNVDNDGELHYCGEMHSELFREKMQVYHHEAGSTVFLTSLYKLKIELT